MGIRKHGALIAALANLVVLGGCETSVKLGDLIGSMKSDDPQTTAAIEEGPVFPQVVPANEAGKSEPGSTGSVAVNADRPAYATSAGLLGSDPKDDLNLGKKHYHAGNYGLAERHFRRAVESHPNDAESWIGLAAAYDRLRRFDLADRAYASAVRILGESPELLNNRGYSFILRGDYRRARETLLAARSKDPGNPYILNNLELLEKSFRQGKAVN
jgi:tetratricopeptide (TPR) repeat protein